jgi:hypothetical protein
MVCDGEVTLTYGLKVAVAATDSTKYTIEKLLDDGKVKYSIGKKVHCDAFKTTDPSPG